MSWSNHTDYSWLYVTTSSEFREDPDFPFLVVNVTNEPCAKFVSAITAERFLVDIYECFGRIIDTRIS